MPWSPAPGAQPEGYYHASTQLANGQMSIMIDAGAWTNLAGSDLGRAMAEAAVAAGYQPKQNRLEQPLSIVGVGNGTQQCRWEGQLPICVDGDDGAPGELHRFDAPLVGGSGSELPAILGLRSIKSKGGVIETRDGEETLTFPGPGGYEIRWAPGARHIKLKSTPSGHLCIPLGDFSSIRPSRGGVATEPSIFHATPGDENAVNTTPGSSSSAMPTENRTAHISTPS